MSDQNKMIPKLDIMGYDESGEYPLSHMDDISDIIIKRGIKKFNNCRNNNIICEDSLNKLIELFKNSEWAIITASRKTFTKEENMKRNRQLRGLLGKINIGVYQVIGYSQECTLLNIDWDECPRDEMVRVFERLYFVPKPNKLGGKDFRDLMIGLMEIDSETQDAIIYSDGEKIYVTGKNGEVFAILPELTLYNISQSYSKYVRKHQAPFILEGLEMPGSNSGRMVMKYENIKYVP